MKTTDSQTVGGKAPRIDFMANSFSLKFDATRAAHGLRKATIEHPMPRPCHVLLCLGIMGFCVKRTESHVRIELRNLGKQRCGLFTTGCTR